MKYYSLVFLFSLLALCLSANSEYKIIFHSSYTSNFFIQEYYHHPYLFPKKGVFPPGKYFLFSGNKENIGTLRMYFEVGSDSEFYGCIVWYSCRRRWKIVNYTIYPLFKNDISNYDYPIITYDSELVPFNFKETEKLVKQLFKSNYTK